MPKYSLTSRSASTAAEALGGKGSFYTLGARLQYHRGLRRWPYPVHRRRTLRVWCLLLRRVTPGVLHHWRSLKSIAAAHSINGSLNHRIGFDTKWASTRIRPRMTCRSSPSRKLPALRTLRQCTAINGQSRARQAIRLVEISTFVENAPPNIEVIHFASVTYVWHSPCMSRCCRNVVSQIQQPMRSCQKSTTSGFVSSDPYYWRIHRDWRCLCRPFPLAGPCSCVGILQPR